MLFLSVADNGPGIPLEDQRRIFDEFEQLESGKAVNHAGTGLGLALTRRLTELHSGRVWVESEPGQGSCFHVVLPLEAVAAAEEAAEEEVSAVAGQTLPPVVVVIEDNLAAATLLSSMLRRAGYRAHVVRDGRQAVDRVRELRPLAITLDVLLPGLDGWEVLRQLKSAPETRDIPVVVVSVVDNRSLGIALGADDYLVKPIDREGLMQAVGRHARKARTRSRALRVLVVDAEEDTLNRLDAELQPSFYVLKARRGREGVELARKHRPDLVLLDLVGEEMAGFEVAAALKSDPRTRDIPVLVAKGEDGTSHLLERLRLLQERVNRNGNGTGVPSHSRR
jgi:CheY-like chemotaxis protein